MGSPETGTRITYGLEMGDLQKDSEEGERETKQWGRLDKLRRKGGEEVRKLLSGSMFVPPAELA